MPVLYGFVLCKKNKVGLWPEASISESLGPVSKDCLINVHAHVLCSINACFMYHKMSRFKYFFYEPTIGFALIG